MTPEQENKIIHEARGLCHHEYRRIYDPFNEALALNVDPLICPLCDKRGKLPSDFANPDYHTETGFWGAWEWAKEQEWWDEFMTTIFYRPLHPETIIKLVTPLINPTTFATVLAEWLEKRGEK